MISLKAQASIDHIFTSSVKAHLPIGEGDSCEIERVTDKKAGEFPEKTIVILTISSFLFRLLTIFHFDENPATRDYFAGGVADKSLDEVFSEAGNLCCGAMKREVSRHFPHTGMSTPYTLSSRCISFLDELKPSYTARYAITINGSVQLHATVCVCNYAPMDFVVDKSAEEEETGALEMF
jgi:hypothetical protein